MILENSNALWTRAASVLAAGPATLSKHPSRYPSVGTPKFFKSGDGCHVKDVDGNTYIDTVASLGPIFLGYGDSSVNAAVLTQVRRGPCFSMSTQLEVEVAERLSDIIPCAEQVRFGVNGSDVTQAAVRLARYVTKKEHVLCCGYHGFNDFYIASTPNAGGILQKTQAYTRQFSWGNYRELDDIARSTDSLACIIVEVPPTPWVEWSGVARDFLLAIKETTKIKGAIFILDEVVTGFRYGKSGAQGRYGVIPDLSCFGKALGNGYPIAALCGSRDLMQYFSDGAVFFSSTFGGNPIGLAAADAVLKKIDDGVILDRLAYLGNRLGNTLFETLREYNMPAELRGNYARMVLHWHDIENATSGDLRTLWMQEMIRNWIFTGIPLFTMTCMLDVDIDRIIYAAKHSCLSIANAIHDDTVKKLIAETAATDVLRGRYENSV